MQSVQSSPLSFSNRPELTQLSQKLEQLQQQLGELSIDTKLAKAMEKAAMQLKTIMASELPLPVADIMHTVHNVAALIEMVDPEFFEDQLESLSDDRRIRRAKFQQQVDDQCRCLDWAKIQASMAASGLIQQLNMAASDMPNSQEGDSSSSDLGILTAISMAVKSKEEYPNLVKMLSEGGYRTVGGHMMALVTDTFSDEEMTLMIASLLENGIDDLGELMEILKLVGELGFRINPKLLQIVGQEIQNFMQTEARNSPNLAEFMAIFQVVQSFAVSEVGDSVFNEEELTGILDNQLDTTQVSASDSQMAASMGLALNIQTVDPNQLVADDKKESDSLKEKSTVHNTHLSEKVDEILKKGQGKVQSRDVDDNADDTKVHQLPIETVKELESSYSAIGSQLMAFMDANRLNFAQSFLSAMAQFVEGNVSATLGALDDATSDLLDPSDF